MRWAPKPKPDERSWRIVTRFAWLPVLTSLPTKQYIWLEFYKVNQQYLANPYELEWCDQQIAPYEYWSACE